jgi:hypothetical protein
MEKSMDELTELKTLIKTPGVNHKRFNELLTQHSLNSKISYFNSKIDFGYNRIDHWKHVAIIRKVLNEDFSFRIVSLKNLIDTRQGDALFGTVPSYSINSSKFKTALQDATDQVHKLIELMNVHYKIDYTKEMIEAYELIINACKYFEISVNITKELKNKLIISKLYNF